MSVGTLFSLHDWGARAYAVFIVVTMVGTTSNGQCFGSVTGVVNGNQGYYAEPFDGILGLGLLIQSNLGQPALPFFYQLWQNDLLTSHVFAINLAGSNPHLNLGGVDSPYTPESSEYHQVVVDRFGLIRWQIGGGSLLVNNQPISQQMITVIDTGSNAIVGPAGFVKTLYQFIPGAFQDDEGSWLYPCAANIPQIGFNWGGMTWFMSAES